MSARHPKTAAAGAAAGSAMAPGRRGGEVEPGGPRRGSSTVFAALAAPSLLLAALAMPLAGADTPWHEDLSYGGGGFWPLRVGVEIASGASEGLSGAPVRVALTAAGSTALLAGAPVASLRAVRADGTEVLYDLLDLGGEPKRSGALAAGDLVVIAADVPAGGKALYYLYAANPLAWPVPEWLRAGFANAGFERGGEAPAGWEAAGTDPQHRLAREERGAREGKACARCEVDRGAPATWVKYHQGGIPAVPGRRYRVRAWVRATGVEGSAGWYVHVHGERELVVNKVAAHSGTFPWRQVEIEFTAPPGSRSLAAGTVLHGTGTAWYDGVELTEAGADAVDVELLPPERCPLEPPAAGPPPADPGRWPWAVPVTVRNAAAAPLDGAMALIDARRFGNHLAKLSRFGSRPRVRVTGAAGRPVPAAWLEAGGVETPGPWPAPAEIVLRADLPARSETRFWLLAGPAPAAGAAGEEAPEGGIELAPAELLAAGGNLLAGGDMEAGDGPPPRGWSAGTLPVGVTARRVRGGIHGEWCLELEVKNERSGWVGWRQRAAVRPGSSYLLAGYVKTRAAASCVRIHGHFLGADGSLTAQPFFATATEVRGDRDWTLTATTVTAPPDCASIEVHLTADAPGTIWHDAVVLAPAARGVTARIVERRPASGLEAWGVSPLVKTFEDDLPPPGRVELEVHAAGNERECAQLAVQSGEARVVEVAVTPLRGPEGATLPPPEVLRAHRVLIDFPMGYDSSGAPAHHRLRPRRRGSDGWAGWWPDALLPLEGGRLELEPGSTESLWIDVIVPRAARPGRYEGGVRLAGGGVSLEAPLRVTVWAFRQPEAKHLPALYDLRRGPGPDIVPEGGGGSAERREAIRRWYRFLAAYNVSPSFILPPPDFTLRDGRVTMDAGEFDRMASTLLDELRCPAVYTPDIFYATGWARLPRAILGQEYGTAAYGRIWPEAYGLFMEHVKERGWRRKFIFYLADEPHEESRETIEALAAVADMARRVAPDVPVYSSTWRHIEGLEGHVSMWGIGIDGSFDAEELARCRAAGDRFWFTTDGHMCIDTPFLAVERLLPWFCFKYDVEAYEFWGVSWWTYDPWERGWHWTIRQSADGKTYHWVRYPNGDGYLAYPGWRRGGEGPVPTIRLLAARDGVEDYELFRALAAHAARGSPRAREVLERVRELVSMRNRGGRYSTVLMPYPAKVEAARVAAGDVLSELEGP